MSTPPPSPPGLDPALVEAAGPPSTAEPTSAAPEGPGARWLRRARDWGLSIALALVVMQVVGALRAPELPPEAPDFALATVDGETLRLSQYRGQTVVLNFWATWCGPCQVEMPSFAAFAENNPDIVVLGLASDVDPAKVRKSAKDAGVGYPVLMADRAVLEAYEISAYPTTVVVGPDGGVDAVHMGMLFRPQLWWLTR